MIGNWVKIPLQASVAVQYCYISFNEQEGQKSFIRTYIFQIKDLVCHCERLLHSSTLL